MLAHFLRRAIMRVVHNEQALIARLRRRNQDLETALDTLRATAHRLNQTEVLTRTDELTGLLNRRGFTADVEKRRRNSSLGGLALVLIDCDRFKDVNDTHGHLAGDRVLQSVANLLRAVAGSGRHRLPHRRRRILPAGARPASRGNGAHGRLHAGQRAHVAAHAQQAAADDHAQYWCLPDHR